MIIYNVTVKIDVDVHDEWLSWMRESHIPDVMATGLFRGHRILRLMEMDESDGITYAIQYELRDMDHYQTYLEDHAPALQRDHSTRYRDKFVAFRTLMRVVE